jgi:hypothetical protein
MTDDGKDAERLALSAEARKQMEEGRWKKKQRQMQNANFKMHNAK